MAHEMILILFILNKKVLHHFFEINFLISSLTLVHKAFEKSVPYDHDRIFRLHFC